MSSFDYTYYEHLQALKRQLKAQPLNLGAVVTGSGAPPGGFIGYLPQERVAHDTEEAEVYAVVGSGNLKDNLKIRMIKNQ